MNEAESRIVIDKKLRTAGWRLPGDKSPNVRAEQRIAGGGRNMAADYVLETNDRFPLAVLEAKSETTDALAGKEQAREYAEKIKAPFVILSNGKEHYFWEIALHEPIPIPAFPSQKQLKRRLDRTVKPRAFCSEEIGEEYIFDVQGADCPPHKRRRLRDYQIAAVEAVQRAAGGGARKFLLEMATGTGKTLVSAALIKLFLATGNARRILFIVDRLELEGQARANFDLYFSGSWRTVVYKQNRDDWNNADVAVSTVQALIAANKHKKFSPLDFDLLIVDEAHRAINGRGARPLFDYFCAHKLGLTATPKDYLRNAAGASDAERDIRRLRDTYRTFGCEPGTPTFRYDLNSGVREGHLIYPRTFISRTTVTSQLLSEKGFSFAATEDENGQIIGPVDDGNKTSGPHRGADYEKKLFSDATNNAFCRVFLQRAMRDPISGDIGKTIVYCVSQKHAAKITKKFNELAAELFPGKYCSDFAIQITSQIPNAADYAKQFANNNLGGKTPQPDGYDSCKTRICITVGMMTTGYDCTDILNICFMRPIFSPSEFIQMRGRGTRPHTFLYNDGNNERSERKEQFALFDFFAVCEYFQKDFVYDEKLPLSSDPEERGDTNPDSASPDERPGATIYRGGDEITMEGEIVLDIMRIDENEQSRAQNKLAADNKLRKAMEQGRIKYAEQICRENHPQENSVLEKIAKQHKTKLQRGVDIGEVLQLLFEQADELQDREAILDEEAEKFAAAALQNAPPETADAIDIFKACLHDPEIAKIVENGEFGLLADKSLPEDTCLRVPADIRTKIITHIKTNVNKTTIRKLAA